MDNTIRETMRFIPRTPLRLRRISVRRRIDRTMDELRRHYAALVIQRAAQHRIGVRSEYVLI